MMNEAEAARELVSRTLADRLIATLDDRPFLPTAAQLLWVDGGDLVLGAEARPRAAEAAGRYADLLVHHVIGDVSVAGAPGAYFRIWQCARDAFLESLGRDARAGGAVGPSGLPSPGNAGGHVAAR